MQSQGRLKLGAIPDPHTSLLIFHLQLKFKELGYHPHHSIIAKHEMNSNWAGVKRNKPTCYMQPIFVPMSKFKNAYASVRRNKKLIA